MNIQDLIAVEIEEYLEALNIYYSDMFTYGQDKILIESIKRLNEMPSNEIYLV